MRCGFARKTLHEVGIRGLLQGAIRAESYRCHSLEGGAAAAKSLPAPAMSRAPWLSGATDFSQAELRPMPLRLTYILQKPVSCHPLQITRAQFAHRPFHAPAVCQCRQKAGDGIIRILCTMMQNISGFIEFCSGGQPTPLEKLPHIPYALVVSR